MTIQKNHKSDCKCPACAGPQNLVDVGWTLSSEIVQTLRERSSATGKSQRQIVEAALQKYFQEPIDNS